MSLLCGAVEDDGVGDSGDGGFFSGTSWRFVFLCSVSGGRRRRFEEDGSRSSFFDISDGFIVLAGDNCFRFVYQLVGKPGWVLFPTFFGGSDPLREDCHPVCWGVWRPAASDSSQSGDAMAKCHLLMPGRSACIKQIDFDVLLKTVTKIYVLSPERRSASSYVLRPPVAMMTGRICLQGLVCNFLFYQGCLCKHWDVTTKNHI